MLISFDTIVKKYGTPNGIVHIGAHLMEERSFYLKNGVENIIWVEANPNIFSKLKVSENEKKYCFAASDKDGVEYDFYVTNNGQSSSILELDKHKQHHPDVIVTSKIKVQSKRVDTLFDEQDLNIDNFDFINLDIQGAELLALKGFGDLLKKVKYIYTEVNTNTIYKNCPLIHEIDEYLNRFQFTRKETSILQWEWGDALYVKKS